MDQRLFALAPVVLVAAACASSLPPTSKAAEVERIQCGAANAPEDLRVLTDAKVIEAHPL
jgi:hypothetical protein